MLLLLALPAWSVDETGIAELQALRDSDPAALLERITREQAGPQSGLDPHYLAHQFRLRAEVLRNRGDYGLAREDAMEFQRRAEALDDPLLQSRALMLHGTLEAEQSNIAAALEWFHQARQLLEVHGESGELARINNAIGVAHNFTHNYERARHYYEEALRLARASGEVVIEITALGNLALTVSEIEGPEAGLALHREALALAKARGDLQVVANQEGNICQRLLQSGDPEAAREACLSALAMATEQRMSRTVAGVQMTLGDISRSQGDLRGAVAHYDAALTEAAGVVPRVELTLRRQLAETHDALGEALPALRHLQAMVSLREELDARERQREVEELEMRYRVEQRERQLEVLTLDAALQEARLRQRTLMLVATGAALLLASLAALLAWRGYRIEVQMEKKLTARNESLEAALKQISHMARTDPLTGLWNRRAFEEMAAREMERAARNGEPLALAMADIDHFKPLNDRHGHSAGDDVLKEVAAMLQAALRDVDMVCRWGGEEFLCLLPASDKAAARRAMDQVRRQLAVRPLEVDGESFTVTMTYGIAAVHGDLKAAIAAADAAMYEGKRAGRNRIEVADDAVGMN